MFMFPSVPKPSVPNVDPAAYDVAGGYDWKTAEELARIRQAQEAGDMRGRANEMLPYMENTAMGRESAARQAAELAMSRSAQQGAGAANPLEMRNAIASRAALNAQIGGAGAQAVSDEQRKAQQQYISAAQAQRALDIQKELGLEEIAQKQMAMGLKDKWTTADAEMAFEREKLRAAGIDLGIWDAATKMSAARDAALSGAIGAGVAGGMGILGNLNTNTSTPNESALQAARNATANNPNWSI